MKYFGELRWAHKLFEGSHRGLQKHFEFYLKYILQHNRTMEEGRGAQKWFVHSRVD